MNEEHEIVCTKDEEDALSEFSFIMEEHRGEEDDSGDDDYSFVRKNVLEQDTSISLSLDHNLGDYGKDRSDDDFCWINNDEQNDNSGKINDVPFSCDWEDGSVGTGNNTKILRVNGEYLLTIGDDNDYGKPYSYMSLLDEAEIEVKQNKQSSSRSCNSSLTYSSIVFALSLFIMNETLYRVANNEISGSIIVNYSQFRDIEFLNSNKTRYDITSSSFGELAENKVGILNRPGQSEQSSNWFCAPSHEFGDESIDVFMFANINYSYAAIACEC